MSYFKKFEKINYKDRRVVNIFDSIILKYREVEQNSLYFKYNIKEGERPEHIAYDFYGDSRLHWIILLTNRVADPYFDWYLTSQELKKLAEKKYDDINEIHHYEYIGDGTDTLANPALSDDVDAIRYKYGEWLDSWYVQKELPVYLSENNYELPQYVTPVTNYGYESNENEKRREINLISQEHIGKILLNFDKMLSDNNLYLTTVTS